MINKVSFMGREDCLTKGTKYAKKLAEASKVEFFGPRVPMGTIAKTAEPVAKKAKVQPGVESYVKSHGIINPQETENVKYGHIDFQG